MGMGRILTPTVSNTYGRMPDLYKYGFEMKIINESNVFDEAQRLWGHAQFVILMEECSELQQAASKFYRDTGSLKDLAEEICDVEICIEQMKSTFDNNHLRESVELFKLKKMERLIERVQKGQA